MDHIDFLPPDDAGQPVGVQEHAHGVLRGRRKRQPLAALRLELANEPPALGRHERARAQCGQSLGDIDRRALGPARLEFGDQLQDGPAVKGMAGVRGKG